MYASQVLSPSLPRYLGLVYDEDATNFSLATATEGSGNPQDDKFSGEGYLINPLKYDEEVCLVGCVCLTVLSYSQDSSGARSRFRPSRDV